MRRCRARRPARSRRPRLAVSRSGAEMPPMLDMLGTPWITSTSPACARLCASNSAIRLTCRRAPSSGSMRWRMLRTVSAGPAMVLPGMVGRSTDAPMTPARDAELVHGVRDDAGRIAQRDQPLDHALRRARYRHQLDVLGRDAAGQSFRLCNRHWSASRSSGFAVSRHFNLLPRGAQSRAPRTERYTDCAAGGGPIAVGPLAPAAPLATVAAFPAQRFAFPRNSDRAH